MRNSRNTPILFAAALVGSILALVIITWGNYQFTKANPGGADFLVHWAGTRALITEGLNPYSDEVALEVQNRVYGRAAQPDEPQLHAVYPLYTVVVFLPFALIGEFALARAVWMTLLEISLVLILFLGLRLVRWRSGLWMLVLLLLFSFFWFHGFRPLINGNVSILVALLMLGGLLALRSGADELAGILFAFSTIKPNMVILALVFVVFWAANKGRWRVTGWMAATLVLLSASAALLIPTWILDTLRAVFAFAEGNSLSAPRAIFMEWWPSWGERVGWALTAVTMLILVIEWISNRAADFNGFTWTLCLTLALSPWSGVPTNPENFVIMFPALLLVFSLFDDRWRSFGRVFVILSLLILFAGIWAIAFTAIDQITQPASIPVLFFPLPAFLLVTLYWVRWWAIRPPTVWYDLLEGR